MATNEGSNTSDKKLEWLQSAMDKYLGEGDDNHDENKDSFPEPQNVRAFSFRTGRENFETRDWNTPVPTPTNISTTITATTSPAGEWVGFIPGQSEGGLGNGGIKQSSKSLKAQYSNKGSISTVLNVIISKSILKDPPTQLDLRKIASEFGNSFSGMCSISDLKLYIVNLSKDARNIQSSGQSLKQLSDSSWMNHDDEDLLIESLSEDDLVIESFSKKGGPLYDHEVLFDPEKGVITNDLSIMRISDKHREAADHRFDAMRGSGLESLHESQVSCEEAFHSILEKFEERNHTEEALESFLWDNIQECLHRFQVIERSEPHTAGVTAAMAVGIDLDSLQLKSQKSKSDPGLVGQLAGILVDEHASWKLLQHLHFHNILNTVTSSDMSSSEFHSDIDLTDKEAVRQLLTQEDRDDEMSQNFPNLPARSIKCDMSLLRVVVCKRWLEECFRVTADFYGYARAPSDVRKESRWSWSQEGLERSYGNQSRDNLTGATVSELEYLDPDACFRMKNQVKRSGNCFNKLAVIDSEDERDLLLDVWRYIRSGDLQLAVDQCTSRFSHWRAATIAGGDLHGYTNSTSNTQLNQSHLNEFQSLIELGVLREHGSMDDNDTMAEYVNEEGNPSRSLWLNTCLASGRFFLNECGENANVLTSGPSVAMGSATGGAGGLSPGVDKALYAIEGTILASLVGDSISLLKSPLMNFEKQAGVGVSSPQVAVSGSSSSQWEDKLWCMLKSMEIKGIQSMLLKHHQRQCSTSSLYPTSTSSSVSSTEGCDVDEVEHLKSINESLSSSMQLIHEQNQLKSKTSNIDVPSEAGDLFHTMGWLDKSPSMQSSSYKVAATSTNQSSINLHHQVQVAAVMGPHALRSLFMETSSNTQVENETENKTFDKQPFTFGQVSNMVTNDKNTETNQYRRNNFKNKCEMTSLDIDEYSPVYLKRFACHFVIMFRMLGKETCSNKENDMQILNDDDMETLNKSDDIIILYVDHLIAKAYIKYVALYCKYIIDNNKKIQCYVKLMDSIQQHQDRETCIKLAFKYFDQKDVEVITRLVVENSRMNTSSSNLSQQEDGNVRNMRDGEMSYFVSPKQQLSKKSRLNTFSGNQGIQRLDVQPYVSESELQNNNLILKEDNATDIFDHDDHHSLTRFQSPFMIKLSNEEVTKIKSIEWLCISSEHKAEAVGQSNELLREFFNCTQSTKGKKGWHIDAAELLIQSNRGMSDTTPPTAFPTQLLARINDFFEEVYSNEVMIGGRSKSEWGRILKEHQCWRVLLKAHEDYMSILTKISKLETTDKPIFKETPKLKQYATQEDIEEHMYMARRDNIKNSQIMTTWLHDKVSEMELILQQACRSLTLVLEFEPTQECYGPCFGEVNYLSEAADMVNMLNQCNIDPTGWMVFSSDHLISEETFQKIDLEESEKDENLKLEKLSQSHGTNSLSEADVNYFRSRMRDRDQRHMDRDASSLIRKEIIPKLLLMLHEVYFSASNWLLNVAEMSLKVGGIALQPQAQQLQRLAVKHLQSSLQVSDMAASRQLGHYTCMDEAQLKRFLAAMHTSAMKLCELRGEVSLEVEE